MGRMTLIMGDEERAQVLAAIEEPGAVVAEVALPFQASNSFLTTPRTMLGSIVAANRASADCIFKLPRAARVVPEVG